MLKGKPMKRLIFLLGLTLLPTGLGIGPFSKFTIGKISLWPDALAAQNPGSDEGGMAIGVIAELADPNESVHRNAAKVVVGNWQTGYTPMILEMISLLPPNDQRAQNMWKMLKQATKQKLPNDTHTWFKWLWKQDVKTHPDYPVFKATLFSSIDKRFNWFFYKGMKLSIRLDEILWGGVKLDGIPPLEHPKMISADEASYLGKNDIVFGVYINGEPRAYPKRILAWHELFNDTVGKVNVTCAYCTLCGSAVLYDQKVGDKTFEFGTSGFLYRSNKLMYDRKTNSLWSALEGVPVSGTLVGSGLRLERLPIVTTKWKDWKDRHPTTKVLSLDTGHQRDYGEGVAYRDYFSHDKLMFPVPFESPDLRNKQEVVALILDGEAVAFHPKFLKKNNLHLEKVGNGSVVILTDKSGSSRVYDATGITFSKWDRKSKVKDRQGETWEMTEEALIGSSDKRKRRIASNRAFWFGWHAQFPESRLVK